MRSILEFVLYLVSGFGYALYYDLNFLEAALVGVVVLCVYRGWVPKVTPQFQVVRAWRAWAKLANRRKTAVVVAITRNAVPEMNRHLEMDARYVITGRCDREAIQYIARCGGIRVRRSGNQNHVARRRRLVTRRSRR